MVGARSEDERPGEHVGLRGNGAHCWSPHSCSAMSIDRFRGGEPFVANGSTVVCFVLRLVGAETARVLKTIAGGLQLEMVLRRLSLRVNPSHRPVMGNHKK